MPDCKRPGAKRPRPLRCPEKYNLQWQEYRGIPVKLILYDERHFAALRAKRFLLGKGTGQNLWIPNVYLEPDGTIKPGADLDWAFKKAFRQNKFTHPSLAAFNPLAW